MTICDQKSDQKSTSGAKSLILRRRSITNQHYLQKAETDLRKSNTIKKMREKKEHGNYL